MSTEFRDDFGRKDRRYPNGERMPDDEQETAGVMFPTQPWKRSTPPSFVMALVFIVGGVLFFLNNLGLIEIHSIWAYWPFILIAVGVSKLLGQRGPLATSWATLLILGGGILLLSNLGFLHLRMRTLWPLAVIAIGFLMLTKAFGVPRCRKAAATSGFGDELPYSDRFLRDWTVFGGVKRSIDSQDFQGGELMSVFGGIEIDLRRAGIISRDRPVVIDANAVFGGISIKVPDNWRVAVRGVGVFGGYEDKTVRPRQSEAGLPLLVITGHAAFGGVVVE